MLNAKSGELSGPWQYKAAIGVFLFVLCPAHFACAIQPCS